MIELCHQMFESIAIDKVEVVGTHSTVCLIMFIVFTPCCLMLVCISISSLLVFHARFIPRLEEQSHT